LQLVLTRERERILDGDICALAQREHQHRSQLIDGPRVGTTDGRHPHDLPVDELDAVVFGEQPGFQCAVQRRCRSAGANPARQLSLQPVAIGATMEVTKSLKPSV
jgi:hypothetical protein